MAARPRIAARRKALGLSQLDLAQRVGVALSTVRRCELGETTPRPWYRPLWAEALGVTLEEFDDLLGTEEGDVHRREFVHGAVIAAASVVVEGTRELPRFGVTQLDDIRNAVARATRLEQASQYAALDILLPGLLADATETEREARAQVEQEAVSLLAQVQALQASVLIKKDRPIEAEAAAQVALGTARRVDDVPVVAAVMRCLGEVHMRAARFGVACDLAVESAELIRRSQVTSREGLAVQGAGYLSGAMACARGGDAATAHDLLDAAAASAEDLGHDHAGLVVFGPSNVDIHRVAIPMELGDPVAALQRAEQTHIELPADLGERRGRYLIDVARAMAARGRDAEAVETLLAAEVAAPEEVRSHRLTKTLLTDLIARERRSRTPELDRLAARCHWPDGS